MVVRASKFGLAGAGAAARTHVVGTGDATFTLRVSRDGDECVGLHAGDVGADRRCHLASRSGVCLRRA